MFISISLSHDPALIIITRRCTQRERCSSEIRNNIHITIIINTTNVSECHVSSNGCSKVF